MPTFFEQFREFLAPRFLLERELGSGGMGTVYLARDTVLDRLVAVKALRPEKASAAAAVRFLREARKLAKLGHPNIVRIYDVGKEADPVFYIMEYLAGDTLADRLTRGVLTPREAARIGRDLLNALKAAHRHGVIHRDIKPSNIFLVDGRGVLTDFGVAKSLTDSDTAVTRPGELVGTPPYMPPEQALGREAPETDLYAVGMVLYESLTGRRWAREANLAQANWTGVPADLLPTLRRALAWSPDDRWPDAAAFERALWRRRQPQVHRSTVLGAFLLALVVLGILVIFGPIARRPVVNLRIDRFRTEGAGVPKGLGDSLAQRIADRLTGFPDFTVTGPSRYRRASAVASGVVTYSGPALVIRLRLPPRAPVTISTSIREWRTAGDLLVDSLLVRLYSSSPLDSLLPVRVMPSSPEGLRAFLDAEKAFARAWWDSAFIAYGAAAAADTTCGLCAWRHAEVARFLALPPDTADALEYRARLGQFPSNYQTLIRAELQLLLPRLDSLDDLVRRSPFFLFGPFRLGDELFHRGPLIGRPRRQGSVPFDNVTRIRGDFAPAWEHLAWLWIAEGDERQASRALNTLVAVSPPGPYTTAIRHLLSAAYAWRFLAPEEAAQRTAALLGEAGARGGEPLDAGARFLNGFGAPRGAVWLGETLESRDYRRRSAMLAQVFGYLGLGQPDRARQVLTRVRRFGDPSLDLFGQEVDAVLLMFDTDSLTASAWADLAGRLRATATSPQVPADLRLRAAWMAALLVRRFGRERAAPPTRVPDPLVDLLLAYDAALGGNYTEALAKSVRLTQIEPARLSDPFFRTALHLLRAEWQMRLRRPQLADPELLWYENEDGNSLPTADPQSMEVDWAFGALARWQRARLGVAPSDEICGLYREVARLWADGEPRYVARADSGRRAAVARGCLERPK